MEGIESPDPVISMDIVRFLLTTWEFTTITLELALTRLRVTPDHRAIAELIREHIPNKINLPHEVLLMHVVEAGDGDTVEILMNGQVHTEEIRIRAIESALSHNRSAIASKYCKSRNQSRLPTDQCRQDRKC